MVERSGPVRRIDISSEKASTEVAEWMKAIRDDGADIDEAIDRLENAEPGKGYEDLDSGDPVPEEDL